MAEHQPGRSAASAVTGDNQASPSAHEKLQRLEMLLVKIHAVVEVSEKHALGSSRLVQCRDTLKEAASWGDEVLASFRQLAMDARATTSNSNELDDDASSTAAAAAAGALFFTRNALSSAKKILFSGDDDTKRLDTAVEALEQLSLDIAEFIRLLQLKILPKIEQTWPTTRKRPPPYLLPPQNMEAGTTLRWHGRWGGSYRWPAPPEGRLGRIKEAIWDEIRSEVYGMAPRRPMEAWIADTPEYEDYQAWAALQQRLLPLAMGGTIGWAVKMMAGRDIEGSGVLAQWATVLMEAEQRARATLLDTRHYLGKYTNFNDDEPAAQCALGRDEVQRVVRSLEMLAGDVESFGGLAALCPYSAGRD